ncbi:hypothetical protein B9Z55_018399 [Caenorhabditis nigoni]|uniref:Uncharacterized protein n=1 Tax=Caenorhabditis nigoni TaxID=1611254 RepID=A0A2G5TE67_9PELO|nr:hypothetical protein B9Z55_018399 [Caenorhabditis nigoni]
MCSNTFASEYAPNVFQLLPACFAYTGASAISLFVYRMEAVIVHRSEQSMVRKFVKITKYAFYVSIVFVLIFTVLIYPDLKNQKPYKMKMEVRFGAFKPYMWCDNCFFCNFDSKIFFAFFYVAGCAVILGGLTGGIAFYVTLRALKSVSSRLTAKTRATHRNYLLSLTLAAAVHVLCIILPLAGFLSAINVLISLSDSDPPSFGGLLLEIHMGHIWKVTVVLPIPTMCSNSFTAEYAPIVFQFLPSCLVYTGVSIVLLFVYRMEVMVVHRAEQFYYRRKITHFSKFGFYISVIILLILSVLIYPDLKYQNDYKLKMEQRFGAFQPYMWCDNCFFFNFDSIRFKSFYVFGAITATLGSFSAGLAFHVTIRTLKSVRSTLSPNTAAIQRNFIISLVVMAIIHGICILLPLLGLLWAISIVITLSEPQNLRIEEF